MSLVRGAMARPVTVAMCAVAAMVVGVVGLRVIPLQLLPSGFEANGMTLIFPYPNADPMSVERDIVRPVEEALATIPELRRVEAESGSNRARVSLEFGGRTDMDLAALEVRDRLERVRGELPREAQRFLIWRHSAESFPDMAFGVLIPEDLGLDGFQVIERRLLPRLARVDGVAAVDTWGGLIDRQAHIELAEDRVRAHRVDLRELVSRLSTENFSLPAGALEDGGQRLLVRAAAPFADLAALERYPVSRTLALGDLGDALIKLGYRDNVSRMDGKDIVWVVVRRESGRNAVEVCRAVRAAVATLADDPALAGFSVVPLWDSGESIEAALDELERSILWGGVLAVLVLVLFLRDLRATLVIAAAIPFSVVVACALLAVLGYTLNVLTLAGLTLAVGMLVDNAIVVVENVLRRREQGEPPIDAAARGSGEVALAVTLATFTSIVVFLPLVFVADEPRVRVMIANLAGPISFGLLASLVTALLVVPLLAARLRGRAGAGVGARGPGRGPIAWLGERAARLVGAALRRRVEAAAVILGLLVAGGGWLSAAVDRRGDEGGIQESIRVRVRLDASTTLAEAHEVFARYERFLIPRRADYGAKHVQVRFSRRGGSIELRLLPAKERGERTIDDLREALERDLPVEPGVQLVFRGRGEEGEGEDAERVTVALTGPDSEVLLELARTLKQELREVPGVEGIDDGDEEDAREVTVELDREAVARAGAAPNAVLGTLGYQLRGSRLRDLRLGGEDVPLILSFGEPEGGESLGWLKAVPVFTARGATPLEAMARVSTGRGPREIERVDRRTQVEVVALVAGDRGAVARADRVIRARMATFPLPEGVSYQVGGAFESFEQELAEIMQVLALGVGFMFLLMGILFESFVLPIAVLPSLPFAFVGAYLGLWATDTPQDVIATLGSVVLAGIVVNNAIVLVDAINRGVAGGLAQTEAVLGAVRDRFRPVLLTAATTVVGLIPMAWEPATEGVLSYHSLARAVIAGLTASTIGTLVAVPLAWVLLDDLRRFALRTAARWWR